MTGEEFRELALALPEAVEQSHMGHPDFRVGGRIFATLGHPDGERAMVKLTPDQQDALRQARPSAFSPASGAWGERGATMVALDRAPKPLVEEALRTAWRNTAPKRLLKLHPAI